MGGISLSADISSPSLYRKTLDLPEGNRTLLLTNYEY